MTPVLDVRHLTTWIGTPRGVLHAVDDVSFTLGRNETLGVVGESGSGKSMLAKTIMGITPRSAVSVGEVRYGGRDLLTLAPSDRRATWGRELSMVFQDPSTSLNPVMRIERQICEVLQLHLGLDRAASRRRAVELLEQVGIPDPRRRLRSYPHEMSGGMRQRVCIAIAIACGPKVLLADEPTTALDVTIQRQILDLLDKLRRDTGMAMVLITHDLGLVARRTTRAVVMYGGQVVEHGPTRALFRAPRHPYTRGLIDSIPRMENRSHTRLTAVTGRSLVVVDPQPGCRFAPRCPRAQDRCRAEDPALDGATADHEWACFFPLTVPMASA